LLAASTNGASPFHLLQFQRAGESMDEADLVLSGLVESGSDAPEKVAQWYVWGTYSTGTIRTPGTVPQPGQEKPVLTAWLQLWDGKGATRHVLLSLTNAVSEAAAAARLVESIQPLLGAQNASAAPEGIRRRVSGSLVDHAMNLVSG
jgi:hypothetical protein